MTKKPSREKIVKTLLDRYGETYSQEIGIDIESKTPSSLFQLLVASVLFSARISANIAVDAARGFIEAGWTSAEKLDESTWQERVNVLGERNYTRYDESTSEYLGYDAELALDRYDGDLRKLREAAGKDPGEMRKRLKEFKGIGDVGVDIFFREVQVAWDELYPFADDRTLDTAGELELPESAQELAELAGKQDYPRLVAALVRLNIAGDPQEIIQAAQK